MTKQIRKLIETHGAEQLKSMIDNIVKADQDHAVLKNLCSDDAQVSQWFRQWAEKNNLTVTEKYNGRRLDIEGMPVSGPYVVLWLSQRGETAHFELGESLEKIWWATGYQDLENKLNLILKMHVEKAA